MASWLAVASSALVLSSCGPPPPVAHAHQLERAASWAGSVVFADELATDQRLPHTFVDDVRMTAAREVGRIETEVADASDVPAWMRREAQQLLDELRNALASPPGGDARSGRVALSDLELRLRTLAQEARRQMESGH